VATFEKRVGTNGKVSWRVKVRRQGSASQTRSFAKKSEAEAWARSVETRIDSGEQLPASAARRRTLAEAIDRYLEVVYPRASRQKNAREQKRILAWWREELGDYALVSLTPSLIAETRDAIAARESRYGEKLSGGTVNRHLAALSAVLKVTVKEFGWLSKNPVTNVSKFSESKGKERFLSDAERDRLLDACAQSSCEALLPIVKLALATGARKGEILALQWSGVDLEHRRVRFADTKNGESRTVPLAPMAVDALKAWRANRLRVGPVFPLLLGTVDFAWRAARASVGLDDVRFHDLRHSAASYLAMSGASLMDIAAILGHKTLAMVKRYSHLSEQHTTAAIDRMAEKFLK
jgi:integrase